MELTKEVNVGQIASVYPLSTRVFRRHGIDYCCGGGIPLVEACKKRGLKAEAILNEIGDEISDSEVDSRSWAEATPKDFIDHILVRFHQPLKEELPRLAEMADKVHQVHGPKDPEVLKELAGLVTWLATELQQHLLKEEDDLFPKILSGDLESTKACMDVIEDEHVQAGHALRRIRELTDNFIVPEAACNTWTALWRGLESLEESLHQHIHLENNILFPSAHMGSS